MEKVKVWCQLEQMKEAAAVLRYTWHSKGPGTCSSARWGTGKEPPCSQGL